MKKRRGPRLAWLSLAMIAAIAFACAKPFVAPPRSVTTLAVLPPNNLTGDALLVAGGTFLEKYAFHTERATVPEVLLAEVRMLLERHGYAVVPEATVDAALGDRVPGSAESAAQLAAKGHLGGNVLYLEIRRWEANDFMQPNAVIVGLDASLIDVATSGVIWTANRKPRPVPTQGAINTGAAYAIAAEKVAEEMFESWRGSGTP